VFQEVKKYVDAAVDTLSPAKAQKLAKQLLDPGARSEQVSKAAQELMEWSNRNRERLRTFVAREVKDQLAAMGVATQAEVEALRKRVRELERAGGATARTRTRGAGRGAAATGERKGAGRAAPSKRTAAKRTTARSTAKGSGKRTTAKRAIAARRRADR